jgi:uncharacterized protein YbjT (DUF2867 family)
MKVVTGAFSYSGAYIARELLRRGERVRTLSRAPAPAGHPLASEVSVGALQFSDPAALERDLRGAEVLFNTYWIRAPRAGVDFGTAVANTGVLLRAAERAGVRRVVHLGVSGSADGAALPYFRGKAAVDRLLRESRLSHAIVRPTLIFGEGDLLLNNIAWCLRRFPLFLVPGRGDYPLQPVAAEDVARLAVEAAARRSDEEFDAAGPDTLAFIELVRAIAAAIGSRTPAVAAPPRLVLGAVTILGRLRRDTMLSADELTGLMAGLLASREPPRGRLRLRDWLEARGVELGRRYVSERVRNWRPIARPSRTSCTSRRGGRA